MIVKIKENWGGYKKGEILSIADEMASRMVQLGKAEKASKSEAKLAVQPLKASS